MGIVKIDVWPGEQTRNRRRSPFKHPCDTFTDWQANVRGIALALEALRRVDRYGVTKRGEQYTGWKRLASGAKDHPAAILAEHSGMSQLGVQADPRKAFLLASKNTHPDQGGDADAFSEVVDAARILGVK